MRIGFSGQAVCAPPAGRHRLRRAAAIGSCGSPGSGVHQGKLLSGGRNLAPVASIDLINPSRVNADVRGPRSACATRRPLKTCCSTAWGGSMPRQAAWWCARARASSASPGASGVSSGWLGSCGPTSPPCWPSARRWTAPHLAHLVHAHREGLGQPRALAADRRLIVVDLTDAGRALYAHPAACGRTQSRVAGRSGRCDPGHP